MRTLVLVVIVCALASGASAQEPQRLSVRGTDIVNANGEVVSMRGINFGGWLMMETWIPSIEMEWHDHLPRLAKEAGIESELRMAEKDLGEFKDDVEAVSSYIGRLHDLLKTRVPADKFEQYLRLFEKEPPQYAAKDMDETMRKRFGNYGAAEVWNAFHDTWLTEHDFQLARALGFNFVRIPFWYRWFESDDKPGEFSDYGFRYLDKAVEWARNQGLYVMLDFHAAPGCQSPWDHTGELSNARLFQDENFQNRTFAIWKAVAAHYRGNPTVFAYDALNEPFSATGLENWSTVHDGIYKAIREADPDTIIAMEEGYKLEEEPWKTTGFFPDPKAMKWDNVMYSFHFYSGPDPELVKVGAPADHDKCLKEVLRVGRMEQKRCGVPIYLGEFNTMGDKPEDVAGMKKIITAFNEEGWHWSPWTWKFVNDDNEATIWGVYQYKRPWPGTPNMHRDSKEYILDLIGRMKTENFTLHEPYAQVLRECLMQPVRAAGK
jgi:hypothetical protein